MSKSTELSTDKFIEKILVGDIKLDVGGHNNNYFPKEKCEVESMFGNAIDDLFLRCGDFSFKGRECSICGKKVEYRKKGNKIIAINKCEFKDGIPEIEVEIDVPSGQLVFYNNLRKFYPELECSNYTGHWVDMRQESIDYAKNGMIYIFVGNTDPGVYQINNESLEIGCYRSTCDRHGNEGELPTPGKKVGSICTDLWWFCAVDKDDFEKQSKMTIDEFNQKEKERGVWTRLDIVNVKPGRYKATGRHHLTSYEDNIEVFSRITRIGDV